ncbi:MAG: LysR family transcriptional regulator [Chthoniobacterales bacterium]
MEIRQVRYFMEVAAGGSFNQAAARLHLTQPAVSRQIKALEEELGVVLLARGKRSVALTQEGEIFYEEAQDLLAHIDRVVRRVQCRRVRPAIEGRSRKAQETSGNQTRCHSSMNGHQI